MTKEYQLSQEKQKAIAFDALRSQGNNSRS